MTDPTIVQPTTEQLIAAMASALLPLAGPYGVAASALVPAVEQLLVTFRSTPEKNYSVEELAEIVAKGSDHLAKLRADVEALG